MTRPIPRSHYRLTEPGVDHYRSFDEPDWDLFDGEPCTPAQDAMFWLIVLIGNAVLALGFVAWFRPEWLPVL